mgnify:CR=1 FL=1
MAQQAPHGKGITQGQACAASGLGQQQVGKTGGFDLVVNGLMDVGGGYGPYMLLCCLFVLCSTFGLFISNTDTAVLLAPILLAAAKSILVSP